MRRVVVLVWAEAMPKLLAIVALYLFLSPSLPAIDADPSDGCPRRFGQTIAGEDVEKQSFSDSGHEASRQALAICSPTVEMATARLLCRADGKRGGLLNSVDQTLQSLHRRLQV